MPDTFELVITSNPLEVVFEDGTELVIDFDTQEIVLVDADAEVLIQSDDLEVLALDAAPKWVYDTKVTVSSTAPANPSIGDLWVIRA